MKKIKITEEYFNKFEDDFRFDDSEYETDQEIEVRIPVEGYLKLKVKCKDPQVAMASVLQIHNLVGILGCQDGDWEIEDIVEEDTYAVMIDKEEKVD